MPWANASANPDHIGQQRFLHLQCDRLAAQPSYADPDHILRWTDSRSEELAIAARNDHLNYLISRTAVGLATSPRNRTHHQRSICNCYRDEGRHQDGKQAIQPPQADPEGTDHRAMNQSTWIIRTGFLAQKTGIFERLAGALAEPHSG